MLNRRQTIAAIATTLALPDVFAQSYPARPIKLISAFAAGGGSDFVARYLAAKLQVSLGQTVIVENKAGAGGTLGTDFVAKSPADGYTLLIGSNGPVALTPALGGKVAYNALRDLQPVAQLTRHPYVLTAAASFPANDVADLIKLAKKQPGHFNYGTPGAASAQHLAIEMLKLQAGIDITHVPYKGGPPALTDMLAGSIHLVTSDINTVMPLIKQGKIKALGVSTPKRSPLLPDTPTFGESGVPGYSVPGWFGALVPAGTPQPIVDRLHAEIAKVMAMPDAQQALGGLGGELLASTPAEFSAFIRSEYQRWRELITKLNIKPDQ
jgi:tripartite-type tricarboxylate transporter receptor subunit TctC